MRLAVIFLGVLAASVILTSLAAWGITYGSSYDRVTTMSAEFTQLAHDVLQHFDTFVMGLLQNNSALVDDILGSERKLGDAWMQQTKAQVLQIIGNLVNYTTNTTGQSQLQMNAMVDTFAALTGSMVTEFEVVAANYASELRTELASKTSATINSVVSIIRTPGLQRFQSLYDLGLLNLSRASSDSVSLEDCVLLGAVCDAALGFGYWESFTVVSAAGRYYSCVPGEGATLSVLVVNGSRYTQYEQTWLPNGGSATVKQRCLAEQPVSTVVGQDCPMPQNCQCGIDQRCSLWYQPLVNHSSSGLSVSVPYIGRYGVPQVTLSYPLVNSSNPASPLLAVASTDFAFTSVDVYLASLGVPNTTYIMVLLDDTNLSLVGSLGRKCGSNETPPGDPSLPLWSALRACDPTTLAVAQWLAQNRSAAQQPQSFELSGILWDVYPDRSTSMVYHCVVGSLKAEVYRAITALDTKASSQLSTVRSEQLRQVAARGLATQAYMAVVQKENIEEVQAMQDGYLAQMRVLETSSQAALAASQASSTVEVDQLMASQTTAVDALKAKHLNALAVATGWILAVVLVILIAALLLSAWGTVQITHTLTNIIALMEDVAHMKVDDLEVPQGSRVREVARIQSVFQVLVLRLAEYKSYMPAGLFQEAGTEPPEPGQRDPEPNAEVYTECLSSARSKLSPHTPGRYSPAQHSPGLSAHTSARVHPLSPARNASMHRDRRTSRGSGVSSLTPHAIRPAKKNVAAMCVNILGFRDIMDHVATGATNDFFNQYITLVHEAVSQGRGNVDCLLGDHIFATFNAHIPCPDPACAAAAAALDIQNLACRKNIGQMVFQVGVSFGGVIATTVGYKKFKSMVTIGWPMKVAFILSHITQFEGGTILVDSLVEERAKYSYQLTPAELVYLPKLASAAGGRAVAASSRVYLLQGKRQMQEDEWLYQLEREAPYSKWDNVFNRLTAAASVEDFQGVLQQYLVGHPEDAVALRLRKRLSLWTPGVGVTLCEGVEPSVPG
eukprot:EG_transcript_758